ncbi:hypothetical protein Cantr_05837 [Candida viswanathii]|uniref:Uncharacterized protein n=1 Tax=Candida viswanathii TaxID=5486 RepID=A0A367XUY4_9ASCO|nr:hypothetical protein Cantr_05837 [Candida viswanathii]
MVDSLYPDLTVQLPPNQQQQQQPPPPTTKESMDYEDLQAKAEVNKLNQLNSKKRQEYMDGLGSVTIEFHEDPPENNSNVSLSNVNRDKQLYHQIKSMSREPTLLSNYTRTRKPRCHFERSCTLGSQTPRQWVRAGDQRFVHAVFPDLLEQLHMAITEETTGGEGRRRFVHPGYMSTQDEEDLQEEKLLNDPQLMRYNLDNFKPEWISQRVTSSSKPTRTGACLGCWRPSQITTSMNNREL